MSNTPKIRFKGFTEDWEQRKFSDFTWNAGKRNKDDLDLEPYAITNEHGFIRQSEAHDDFGYMKDTDRKAYNIVMPNSFAYNPARINVGSIGYYEGTENVIVSSLYEVFQTADYVDDRFLWHWFKSEEFPRWIERLQEGSVRLYFYYDKLCECQMLMPSVPEQQKIAKALDELDNLITLHQRKCDETKELKKFMLQKMFPKNGEQVPEIRFAGFTDDWEQRKCKDIFDKVGVPVEVKEGDTYREIGIRSHGKGLFYKDEVTSTELGNKRVFWIEPDCFIVNIVFAWERAVAKTTENEIGMIASHRFPMYKPKAGIVDLDYITKFFTTDQGKKILEMASPGGAGRNRTLGQIEFAESKLSIPSYNEQKKIGRLIDDLDTTITLHQRKCDNLKEVKKYMLQNMFPQKG